MLVQGKARRKSSGANSSLHHRRGEAHQSLHEGTVPLFFFTLSFPLKSQPLEMGFFKVFKNYYDYFCAQIALKSFAQVAAFGCKLLKFLLFCGFL
jgi:hypothetical protein